MGETLYGKTPFGQLFYDLAFTDVTPKYLARKHKISAEEVRNLRAKARQALIGKCRIPKARRDRAVASAAVLNRILDDK